MIFYHYELNEYILRVDGLFYCLWFHCDTSRLNYANYTGQEKSINLYVRFLGKPTCGVILERAFHFCPAFLQMSSIWFFKVSLLSLLLLLFFITSLLTLTIIWSSMLQIKWHLSGFALFNYYWTIEEVVCICLPKLQLPRQYLFLQHMACYHRRNLQIRHHS